MNLKKEKQQTVFVSGKGESKTHAFASALSNIQRELMKNKELVLLQATPVDVELVKAELNSKKERFLFFFLPRENNTYYVELNVQVKLTYIDYEDVLFSK